MIQIGCNYHTKWQKNKAMRFVLKEIKGDKARLVTRRSRADFWTNVSDLIFIETKYNKSKANKLKAHGIQNTSSVRKRNPKHTEANQFPN